MGSTELKFIVFGAFFFVILGTLLNQTFPAVETNSFDQQEVINELTSSENLGTLSGFITGALLNIGLALFGLFGIDFIGAIIGLPAWINVLLGVFMTIYTIFVIMYLIDRLWVG